MAEAAPDWWQTWFGPGYLALYDAYLAERTPVEADQLETLLQIHPPRRFLDLPCGQGRHSIERAAAAGVRVRWLKGDMRRPIQGETFDIILNLFTSFGYFADPADDQRVLT